MKKILLLLISLLFLAACAESEKENTDADVIANVVTNTITNEDGYDWTMNAEKETLVLGTYPRVMDRIRKPVLDFNISNSVYQIEIREYEDASQLISDIITRKAPDIILLPPHFMMAAYADKGLLVDLNPMLDSDRKINRTDLQENILEAYEVNGQLLGMPINYQIRTIAAANAQYGDRDSWTLDEMIKVANELLQLPEAKVFRDHSKSEVLDLCLLNYAENIIGWNDSGAFDRDLYLKILYFANQFTPDHLYKYEVPFDLIRDNRIQFTGHTIYSVQDIQASQFVHSEPITFIGFPTEEGSGNIAHSDTLIAISSSCLDKETAWAFISSMLTEEYQISSTKSYPLPIRKSAMEEIMNEETKTNYSWRGSDVVFVAYLPTEDEKQKMRDLIISVTKTGNLDARIEDILREEGQSFLTGHKSAEEAADIAANRIGIIMKEF